MLNYRIPVEKFAVLAGWQYNRFSVNYLLVNHDVVELDCYLLVGCKANVCCIAIERTSLSNLLDDSSSSLYLKHLINSFIFDRVGKRDRLLECSKFSSLIGYNKLSSLATWSTKGSHIHLKHQCVSNGVWLTWLQLSTDSPFLLLSRRNYNYHLFFNLQVELLASSKFEIDIVIIELIDEDTTKLLSHVATSWDNPIISPDCRSRTVKTEFELNFSLLCAIVSNYEIEFFVLFFDLSQVESIPSLTCWNIRIRPVELLSLGTSVIHDVAGLILLSREFDVLLRVKF